MFSHYQDANKIANMTGLDLSLSYKRNIVCGTTVYHKKYKTTFFEQTFPRSAFYCSCNNKCSRVLDFFKFFFEQVTHCVKSLRIRSCSGPHFPALRLNTEREILRISPYSVRMRENVDQDNSEYGHFSRSD